MTSLEPESEKSISRQPEDHVVQSAQLEGRLDILGSRQVSNGFVFSDDILVDIQLGTFLLLSNITELSTGAKTKKHWQWSSPVKYTLPNKKSYPFSDIYTTFFS